MRAIGVFGTVCGKIALRLWWSWSRLRVGADHGSFLTWIQAATSELLVHIIVVLPDWLEFVSTIAWLKTSANLSNGEETTRRRAEIRWKTRHSLPMGRRGGKRELGQVHVHNQ
jgi:hypothetical protein